MQSEALAFNPTTKADKSPPTTFVGVWSSASEYKNVHYEKFILKNHSRSPPLKLSRDKNRTDLIKAQSDFAIKLESVLTDKGALMLKY